MTLSCVPPVAASLIATLDTVLHIAPVSRRWKADAPGNVVFLPPTLTKQTLLLQIALLRPSALIVADQVIDAEIIERWRTAHPFGDLCLIRRGTSLDKVRLDLCEANDIRVINTPGVNAPHVAAYMARWLTLGEGALPSEVGVVGYGNVGKALVRLLLERDPHVRIKVLGEHQSQETTDSRVTFAVDRFEALTGAHAVALCPTRNDETTPRIDGALIECLHPHARLVCVVEPDVFSDDAVQALAVAEHLQLVLGCGSVTLGEFRSRAQLLGCSLDTWRRPVTFTIQATSSDACHGDLDHAVCVQQSLMAVRGLLKRSLAKSFTIPTVQTDAAAPCVSIVGRGINSLFQAVMFRLANYQVTVYGTERHSDDARLKHVNTWPMSTTQPTAEPEPDHRLPVECHRAGLELFEKLLADNPSLARFAHGQATTALWDELEALLGASGVRFLPQQLSPAQTAALSRRHCVVSVLEGDDLEELSIVYRCAHNRIVAGGTYAAGTTQGLLWASLVQEIIQAKAPMVLAMNAQ
ncbi:amino acid dehydrogenase [Pseudomonas rhodesiae]|uniref:amino acid dehydrogenase n=1 Tax=Pseudomonas rhodesiae TaxID=76760 RepID=UPI0028ADCEDC|nr:amino acid dehydrogenase [Pseudomonas rhodesiae]